MLARAVRWLGFSLFVLLAPLSLRAQEPSPGEPRADKIYSLHFQQTTVTQGHPSFHAPYSGLNSLHPDGESELSITATMYGGVALWRGAEVYLNPELSGGSGISSARGVAGFTNGEAFRIGDPTPIVSLARLFLRQTIDLGEPSETVEDDANAIATHRSTRRLTLTAGKFGIADIFDNNRYTHDPRTQFLNWSLMNSGAWDYPADTRGYTWGLSLEYVHESWTLRAASVLVPVLANGLAMDTHVDKSHGIALEGELRHQALGRPGTVRWLLFLNNASMGDYEQAISSSPAAPDVSTTRKDGRTKYGFALGFDQEIAEGLGAFARLSWNDGKHETWAFAEIDHSLAAGVVWSGTNWSRPHDEVGAAVVVNGISGPHRRYLATGGYGFMIGDGSLHYGLESIAEAYYKLQLIEQIAFSADYQLVADPAYNRDRGPVHVLGLRSHVEF